MRAVFASELFPTEVRATLGSLAGAVIVAAGSVGLFIAGALSTLVEPRVTVLGLGAVCAASALLLRRLPETAGADVFAVRQPHG